MLKNKNYFTWEQTVIKLRAKNVGLKVQPFKSSKSLNEKRKKHKNDVILKESEWEHESKKSMEW